MSTPDASIYGELRWILLALVFCALILAVRFWPRNRDPAAHGYGGGSAGGPGDRRAWHEALQAMQARSDIDGRVRALEQSLEHVPSSTDFAELEGKVNNVVFRFESQADELKSIRTTLYRIEDFLLKGHRQ